MTPEPGNESARYALLLNGSRFACAVLRALLDQRRVPALLVLPEYAPAPQPAGSLLEPESRSPLQRLAGSIEIVYAPRSQQHSLAKRLRHEGFEYLLVACWPYLVDAAVCASVTRAALNLHPSLLPAYRGADPIGAQLARGENRPGVSLHLLGARFDRGDILAQAPLPGSCPPPNRIMFETRCARLGARLFSQILDGAGRRVSQAQLGAGSSLQTDRS